MREFQRAFSFLPVPGCGLAWDEGAGQLLDGEVAMEGADGCFHAVFAFHLLGYACGGLDGGGMEEVFDGTCEDGDVECFMVQGPGSSTRC